MGTVESFSDIVQIPVIRVDGELLTPISEYSKLDYPALRAIADTFKGSIEYLKLRAEYAPITDADLCNQKDCFRPRSRCSDHVRKSS